MRHRYIVVFDREADGRVIASVPGVPGCIVYGRTYKEATRKVRRLLEFALREFERRGVQVPRQPEPVAKRITVAM